MTVSILVGDVRARLAELTDESVHCVVTSPPYWGLRSYGTEPQAWGGDAGCDHDWADRLEKRGGGGQPSEKVRWQHVGTGPSGHPAAAAGQFCSSCGAWRGELGMEPTLGLWLEHCVEVFREVRRVLRRDGTLWLNLGDAYATGVNGRSAADTKAAGNDDRTFRDKPFSTVGDGLKPKDLMMMPARLVLALQADGWWLRSEIVWAKPNPMPESVRDRPTNAHEKVFLLTKATRYFYDADAVRIPFTGGAHARRKDGEYKPAKGADPNNRRAGTWKERRVKMPDGWDTGEGAHGTIHRKGRENGKTDKRVRTASSFGDGGRQSYESGYESGLANLRNVWTIATHPFPSAHFATFPPGLVEPCIKAGCPAGGVVLDPFGGSGTTGLVADRLGRDAILIELNPEYAEMARKRIEADGTLFSDVRMEGSAA